MSVAALARLGRSLGKSGEIRLLLVQAATDPLCRTPSGSSMDVPDLLPFIYSLEELLLYLSCFFFIIG